MITSNEIEDRLLEDAESVYNGKINQIYEAKHFFPIMVKLQNNCPEDNVGSYFVTSYGALWWASKMIKKEAFIFLDEALWSKGIETEDPYMLDGEICCNIKDGGKKLHIEIGIKEGNGCERVAVGKEWTTKYEWRCD